ncbi:MAG: hypothetical protein AAF721_34920, partial [Myxococcota bacterium]
MTSAARCGVLAGVLGSACASSGGAAAPSPAAAEAEETEPVAAEPPSTATPEPIAVLVTGFNDWKELGDPPNVWRCRDNPSCRLLLGGP